MSDAAVAVTYEVSQQVATITMNRPDARNAMDLFLKEALRDAIREAAADEGVRCVVLTGSGPAFSVGQDLREHALSLRSKPVEEIWGTVPAHYNPIALGLATMPKPVIAAVNGIAAGAGASMAFACDLRVLADTAGFNLAFAGVGLSCDTGSSWTLPRLIGHARAIDLLLRPRTVRADEALALGLATQVVPADEVQSAARALAVTLASGPTAAYAAIRLSLAYSATHGLEESLAFEAEMMAETGATDDHRNAVEAFVSKQQPTFTGH
jgi:2-(1,2-epoxy-1,2-dihydrophenyl)acetyl-CoA isomerase